MALAPSERSDELSPMGLYSQKSFSAILHTKSQYLLLGFGLSNLMLGRIIRSSSSITAFMILVMADAPSEWPRFGLTLKMLANPPKKAES